MYKGNVNSNIKQKKADWLWEQPFGSFQCQRGGKSFILRTGSEIWMKTWGRGLLTVMQINRVVRCLVALMVTRFAPLGIGQK